VSQSLAGRTAILHLLPLAFSELFGRRPLDPWHLDTRVENLTAPGAGLWSTLWAGFYPRIHDRGLHPAQWLADYQRTYVERDLRDVLRVVDLDAFERFMRLVAARTGQELNLSALATDAGITQPTAKHWLTALRIGFIVTVLTPHHVSFRKRLRKTPRLHFLDTGLACYLLGIPDAQTLERHPLRGAIFESYVVSELIKAFENGGHDPPLFFWKDRAGHEVDALADLGVRLLPVEAKSGLTLASDAFDGLRFWLDLPGNPNDSGVVVYGGVESYVRNGVTVLPWFLS
jgi:predicted AAA+ superfamily ATPase